MQGNVQEWCDDVYRLDVDGVHVAIPDGSARVVRGGSALTEISMCRAAARHFNAETRGRADLGFRVVRDP